jgi:hypothetical protein
VAVYLKRFLFILRTGLNIQGSINHKALSLRDS